MEHPIFKVNTTSPFAVLSKKGKKSENWYSLSGDLRYEQAKHVDGLQCDSWILLKCFRSRVMAGSPDGLLGLF